MSYPASLRIMWPIWIFIVVMSSGHPSEPASTDTGSDQSPKVLPITSRVFQSPYLPKYHLRRFFRSACLLLLLLKIKLHRFCKPDKKEKGLTKYRCSLAPILRQALLTTYCVAIRSVRIFFLWKLTATTLLQIGHLILIMPSVSGSASNNLLFLQHGQATCISSFMIPPSNHIP